MVLLKIYKLDPIPGENSMCLETKVILRGHLEGACGCWQ